MKYSKFNQKWSEIDQNSIDKDESSLFVEIGEEPTTQRQLNLYYYYIFIKTVNKKVNAKKALEVGCGRGTMSMYLKEYLDLDISLLDNTEEAIRIAKKFLEVRKINAEYYVKDVLSTGINDKKFDLITSIGLAEHIDDVEALFREQYRLLNNGGAMVSLNIPKKFSAQFLNDIYKYFKCLFTKNEETKRKNYYRNKLKPIDYKKLAEKVGFKDVAITHVCPFPIYVPISIESDKKITKIRKIILKIRKIFQKYPYKTNYWMSQGHFLVGYKK
jgi:ubiquinone/menaquinone biosynthesis C-methylase UbiE